MLDSAAGFKWLNKYSDELLEDLATKLEVGKSLDAPRQGHPKAELDPINSGFSASSSSTKIV